MLWYAYIEDDEEGNSCVWIQLGEDESEREMYEMVEHDIKDSEHMVKQLQDYFEEATAICKERNIENGYEQDGDE